MPSWIEMAIARDSLDLAPKGAPAWQAPSFQSTAELLAWHDEAVAKARAALGGTSDELLKSTWKLLVTGRVVLEQPREVVVAETFNHLAHHRGQLTVYLRLLGAPVPALYGPSADEKSF
jgi:uncharacterized damage-inducible protein DinB